MSKCPECGTEIDHLNNYESGQMGYKLSPDGGYEGMDFDSDGKENYFECPECQKTLFTDEREALEFLKKEEPEAWAT